MALKINTISTFRNDIEKLCKHPKHGYSSVVDDVKSFFNSYAFEELFQLPIVLKFTNVSKLVKRHVENSGSNRGKSGSFRLIYIINKDIEEICLLHIYPKTGKYSKSNTTEKEIKDLQKTFLREAKDKKLEKFEL